ncbi:hypothetical protein ACK31R_01055 [Aeromonas caviae]
MFDHVEIKVVRFDSCQHFYATVLAPLLIELKWSDEAAAGFGLMGRDHVGFLIERGQQGCFLPSRIQGRRHDTGGCVPSRGDQGRLCLQWVAGTASPLCPQ